MHGLRKRYAVTRSAVTWRYMPGQYVMVKHALRVSSMNFTGHADVSLCGMWPWGNTNWMGTGRQAEYDRLASLRECKTCLKYVLSGIDDGTGSPKKEDSKIVNPLGD